MKDYIEVFPPHGFVRLVNWHGTELDIVNAARVSFHKESEWAAGPNQQLAKIRAYHALQAAELPIPPALRSEVELITDGVEENILSLEDAGLVKFLLKNRHGSPFEQGFQSTWHIRLPIFVMREWVRHRIGHSVNEESGRYVEMRPDFYIPECARTQHGKPGAYTFEFDDKDSPRSDGLRSVIQSQAEIAFSTYRLLLREGIAKEQARIILPLNLYTEIRWTANARSLMHFLGLRNNEHAMFEIRSYAAALERLFGKYMPVVHRTFVDNGRVAP